MLAGLRIVAVIVLVVACQSEKYLDRDAGVNDAQQIPLLDHCILRVSAGADDFCHIIQVEVEYTHMEANLTL